jgi:LasA protease
LMQTGWTVIYMHMPAEGRVLTGTLVNTGDPLGHPGCEGGTSSGVHVHIARRFDGEWVGVDGSRPFVLGGWTAVSGANEYDGYLERDGVFVPACACRRNNAITNEP